jgi:hypothetical protein
MKIRVVVLGGAGNLAEDSREGYHHIDQCLSLLSGESHGLPPAPGSLRMTQSEQICLTVTEPVSLAMPASGHIGLWSMRSMRERVFLYVAATLAWPSPGVGERNQITLLTAQRPCLTSLRRADTHMPWLMFWHEHIQGGRLHKHGSAFYCQNHQKIAGGIHGCCPSQILLSERTIPWSRATNVGREDECNPPSLCTRMTCMRGKRLRGNIGGSTETLHATQGS